MQPNINPDQQNNDNPAPAVPQPVPVAPPPPLTQADFENPSPAPVLMPEPPQTAPVAQVPPTPNQFDQQTSAVAPNSNQYQTPAAAQPVPLGFNPTMQPTPQALPLIDNDVVNENPNKSYVTAWVLSYFLGFLGLDRFYLGHTGLGVAKLLTAGAFGIWTTIDWFLVAFGKETENGNPAPLNGYAKNSKLIKRLTIGITVVSVLAAIITVIVLTFAVVQNLKDAPRSTNQDTAITDYSSFAERVNNAKRNVEAYNAENDFYPTDAQYKSGEFVEDYRIDAFKESTEGTEYTASPFGCDNEGVKCSGYEITN